MATIIPEGWRQLETVGSAQREIETLAYLAAHLPDSYTVYHGVHWTRINENRHAIVGEIDFAIVNPAGKLLLIEQKSGFLNETPEGLAKVYGTDKRKLVTSQMTRTVEGLRTRLATFCKADPLLESLLYCPDYRVEKPGSAGIEPARIVDASRRAQLAAIIRQLLPDGAADSELAPKIHRFLRNELQLVADVSTLIGQIGTLYTRLSGGLSEWARAIECDPFRLRVVGTAGSGKTQLALQVLRDADTRGQRALYVCYNRPLADHVHALAPASATVATYHQLGDHLLRAAGQVPDFSQPGAFQSLETFMSDLNPAVEDRFDCLVVDEGQDFQPVWRDNLLRLLRPDGHAWWLEDPLQNLYQRPSPDFGGWVTLRSNTNYRSPTDIQGHLNRLLGQDRPVAVGSPLASSDVEILTYTDHPGLMDATKTAIARALGAGFKKSAMAVVTYRGREHSHFTPLDTLGSHHLKAFTGRYDLLGSPIFSEGDLLIESVYRFKGQSAPCIIFTEIDFETLDEAALRKLFVGMTRATIKLILVLSERAAKAWSEAL